MVAGRAVAGTNQFTPRQVLDAGRRAESDGKWNYAVQFYQHVVAHHPQSPEANEADQALRRLAVDGEQRYGASTPTSANGAYGSRGASPVTQPAVSITPQQRSTHRASAKGQVENGAQAERVRTRTDSEGMPTAARVLGTPRGKRYRLGRFIATLIGLGGFSVLITGLASLCAFVFTLVVGGLPPVVSGLIFSPLVSAGMIAAACPLILLAQMAKAIFHLAMGQPHVSHNEAES